MSNLRIFLLPILVVPLLFCGSCGRESDVPREDDGDLVSDPPSTDSLQVVAVDSDRLIKALRRSAEDDQPEAQRELAKRLLFGDGMSADPAESIRWARRAAMNGDELASLWTGRAALSDPVDRIEAGAWFLIAKDAQEGSVCEDAESELGALALNEEELLLALARAAELRQVIRTGSE